MFHLFEFLQRTLNQLRLYQMVHLQYQITFHQVVNFFPFFFFFLVFLFLLVVEGIILLVILLLLTKQVLLVVVLENYR